MGYLNMYLCKLRLSMTRVSYTGLQKVHKSDCQNKFDVKNHLNLFDFSSYDNINLEERFSLIWKFFMTSFETLSVE